MLSMSVSIGVRCSYLTDRISLLPVGFVAVHRVLGREGFDDSFELLIVLLDGDDRRDDGVLLAGRSLRVGSSSSLPGAQGHSTRLGPCIRIGVDREMLHLLHTP